MDNKYVNKALELSSKVASNVYLDAISKGLMGTLPILIIGSIGCLLGVFPFDPYLQFIEKIGVKTYFLAASTVTTSDGNNKLFINLCSILNWISFSWKF